MWNNEDLKLMTSAVSYEEGRPLGCLAWLMSLNTSTRLTQRTHDIRLPLSIVSPPPPSPRAALGRELPDALGAVLDRGLYAEVVQVLLLFCFW